MQMEMSLAKSPNKVCFYKDLHVVSLIVWAVFFQFVTIVNFDRQFRHQIVFLLHAIHEFSTHMLHKCT